MSKRTLAILAAIGATSIYGLNHTIAKGVMPHYVGAFGFVVLRVIGAAALFWIISIFGPKEKIDKKDYLRMLICAILGMGVNMLVFFKGLSLSTPINSAVLITTTPIIVQGKNYPKKSVGYFYRIDRCFGFDNLWHRNSARCPEYSTWELFNFNEFGLLRNLFDIG